MNCINDWKIYFGIKINDFVRDTGDDVSYKILENMIIGDNELYKNYCGVALVDAFRGVREYSFILDQRIIIDISVLFGIVVSTNSIVADISAVTRDRRIWKIGESQHITISQPRFSQVFKWINHYYEKINTCYHLSKEGLYDWKLGGW